MCWLKMSKVKLEKCVYCDGYDYQCREYTPGKVREEQKDLCYWYDYTTRNLDEILLLIEESEEEELWQ